MLKKIKVKSGRNDRQVVLFEKHKDHPSGQAFVSQPDRVYEVAETPLVLKRLSQNWLVRVEQKAAVKKAAPKAKSVSEAAEK